MKKPVIVVCLLCALSVGAPQAGEAVIAFTQLAEDVFVVSHRVKFVGSRGQAMKLAYTKAASLCVAAGFTHLEILQQESQAASEDELANASIRVQLFQTAGDDRIVCEENADSDYVTDARKKLLKQGYRPPDPVLRETESEAGEPPTESDSDKCSIEQIVAMVKAGLDVEQIKAACSAN